MKKIKIGVLCPSEIAFRRFMPALIKNENFKFMGVAIANNEEWFGTPSKELINAEQGKAQNFIDMYGGRLYTSYGEMLGSNDIDTVYIPLPPALHYMWAKIALENRKHILLEKPFTTSLEHTQKLLSLARNSNLAVHENYMFVYHTQLEWIKKKIVEGVIGEIRLIRIDFGFPFRGVNDFRYNPDLGGGALLDCGGYTVKLANVFLGNTAKVVTSQLNNKEGFEVDMYGSATLINNDGLTAQVSFGMDNSYKCSLEIWGSTGTLFTNRILTAPDGFEPIVFIRQGNEEYSYTLSSDDTFEKSIKHFEHCICNEKIRIMHYEEIVQQSAALEKIIKR